MLKYLPIYVTEVISLNLVKELIYMFIDCNGKWGDLSLIHVYNYVHLQRFCSFSTTGQRR